MEQSASGIHSFAAELMRRRSQPRVSISRSSTVPPVRRTARALFHSLVPPTTWMGFLTARARYELGELEQQRGDAAAAAFHYRRALDMWRDGGPGVAQWVGRTRDRLASLAAG